VSTEKNKNTIPVGPVNDFARRAFDLFGVMMGTVVLAIGLEMFLWKGGPRVVRWIGLGFAASGGLIVVRILYNAAIDALERKFQFDLNRDGRIAGNDDRGRPILVNKRPTEQKDGVELWESFVKTVARDSSERSLLRQGFTDRQIGVGRDALLYHQLAAWHSTDRRHGWGLSNGVDDDDVLEALAYCDLNEV
jgi:hypothetical protein